MSELRERLQSEVERHWPDYCTGCGTPDFAAEFEVEVGRTESGKPRLRYECGRCPVNTFVQVADK